MNSVFDNLFPNRRNAESILVTSSSILFSWKLMNIKLPGVRHYFSFDLFLVAILPHLPFASNCQTFSVNPFSVINEVMKVKQREHRKEASGSPIDIRGGGGG